MPTLQHSNTAVVSLRESLLPIILAFVFIFIANTAFSTVAAGQKPLSIKVGAYLNPPKIFMNADGKVSGFWPDLIEHIAKIENWKIEYIWGTWSEGLDLLKNKEIAIMPDVAFTENRSKLYAFSEYPVLISWTRLYVNKENTEIKSILDLKNKKIAALKGSVNLEGPGGLREITCGFNLNCTFLELDNYTEVFKAVEESRADAGITNRNFGNKYAKNFKVKMTPTLFQPINMKFAFPKDAELTPYLVERINYHIKKLKQDAHSVYYQLLEKYFEAEIAERKVEVYPRWLSNVLKSIVALFVFFILVTIVSRMQVKRKSDELRFKNETMRESEERYRSLYSSMNEGVALHEVLYDESGEAADYRILDVNPAFESVIGIKREDAIGAKASELYGTGKAPYLEIYAKVVALGESTTFETAFEPMTKSFKISVFSPARGRFATLFADITKRKQAEEAMRESKERLALTLDASNSGIWGFDPRTFTYTHYSETCFTMLGYEPDELPHTAEAWTMLMHPEDLGQVQKKLQDHIEKKIEYSVEFRMKTKDGGYRWIRSIGKIVSWDDKANPKRMVGIHVDINDLKQVEKELAKHRDNLEDMVQKRTAELEEKNEQLEQFNKLFVGRELRMVELKEQIKALEKELSAKGGR